MSREVTVGLVDLKILVGMCMDQQVDARAQAMVLTDPGRSEPTADFEFAGLVAEAKPEATKRVRSRFHRLLEALESGNDVTEAARLRIRGQKQTSSPRSEPGNKSPYLIGPIRLQCKLAFPRPSGATVPINAGWLEVRSAAEVCRNHLRGDLLGLYVAEYRKQTAQIRDVPTVAPLVRLAVLHGVLSKILE
jgi:hypothetical protein